VTGVAVEDLPPRVCKLKMPEILSKWLGESDKNLDGFFAELETLASQPYVGPDGREHDLPVLAILEEIDGLARSRGQEPIYDRILTTALQRLDPTRQDLRNKLIVFIGTTNDAQHVDRAFLRRIGGTIEHFGRLKRRAFEAVLEKHLAGRPILAQNGSPAAELERRMVNDLTDWLFSRNGSDRGVVELTFTGSTTSEVRHRRDFLTGAMVDRAVQQASEEACRLERLGQARRGLSLEQLLRAFEDQVRGVVDQLTPQNVHHYLALPDGVRVATVRRLPQPPVFPMELQFN